MSGDSTAELKIAGASYRATSMEVTLRVNDISTLRASAVLWPAAEVKLGDEVEAYINGTLVFKGKIIRVRKSVEGPRAYITVEAVDFTEFLRHPAVLKCYEGLVHEVILALVKPLTDAGVLTANNVETSTEHATIDLSNRPEITILDALKEFCGREDVNYVFFVDENKDLHAFRRGSRTSGQKLDILRYDVEEDVTFVINDCTVLGAQEKYVPSEGDLCEDLSGWSVDYGSAELSADTENVKSGSASIKVHKTSADVVRIKRALDSPLDLTTPSGEPTGWLEFYFRWSLPELYVAHVTIWLCTDADNRFERSGVLRGKDGAIWGVEDESGGELPVVVPIDDKWLAVGSPDWKNINAVVLAVNFTKSGGYPPGREPPRPDGVPLEEFPETVDFWIDGLRFGGLRFSGHYEDASSIAKYGRRKLIIKDPSIRSDDEAYELAEKIVEARREAPLVINSLEALGNAALARGEQIHIETADFAGDFIMEEIVHRFERDRFTTELRVSGYGRGLRRVEEVIAPPPEAPEMPKAPPKPNIPRTLPPRPEPQTISNEHFKRHVRTAIGRFFEAENHPGTTGTTVSNDTASGKKARRAASTDPAGVLVEVV